MRREMERMGERKRNREIEGGEGREGSRWERGEARGGFGQAGGGGGGYYEPWTCRKSRYIIGMAAPAAAPVGLIANGWRRPAWA